MRASLRPNGPRRDFGGCRPPFGPQQLDENESDRYDLGFFGFGFSRLRVAGVGGLGVSAFGSSAYRAVCKVPSINVEFHKQPRRATKYSTKNPRAKCKALKSHVISFILTLVPFPQHPWTDFLP